MASVNNANFKKLLNRYMEILKTFKSSREEFFDDNGIPIGDMVSVEHYIYVLGNMAKSADNLQHEIKIVLSALSDLKAKKKYTDMIDDLIDISKYGYEMTELLKGYIK